MLWPLRVASRAGPVNTSAGIRDEPSQAIGGDYRARANFARFNAPFSDQFVELGPSDPDSMTGFGYREC